MIVAEPDIGKAPLKCGRFLTHTRNRINTVAEEYLYSFPKTNCCRSPQKNRKPRTKPSSRPCTAVSSTNLQNINDTPKTSRKRSLHFTPSSVSKRPRTMSACEKENQPDSTPNSNPKRKVTNSSKKKRNSTTPSSTLLDNDKIMANVRKSARSQRRIVNEPNPEMQIDDPLAVETWKPKRMPFTYFQGNELRKLMSPRNLGKIFAKTENNDPRDRKLPNHLTDNPDVYMLTTTPFAVASYQNYVLYNMDFKTLSEAEKLSNFLIQFVCKMFASERKDIQIETAQTKQLFEENSSQKILKIQAKNFMGVMFISVEAAAISLSSIAPTKRSQ